jgi:aldose sugar dehydrogenase
MIFFILSLGILFYIVGTYYNFYSIQAQNDSLFLEKFEETVRINGNDTDPVTINGNYTGAILRDPNLNAETVFKGIKYPTSMTFLGRDDILVLEKDNGTVRRIVNGQMLDEALLDVNVANKQYRGMLGIAVSKNESKDEGKPTVYVFLYYTETNLKDGEDIEGGSVLGNRLYRYELENNKLVNPMLLLDLPGERGADHTGGDVLIGPDQYVYLIVGDGGQFNQAQNVLTGKEPNGTSAILRITQNGRVIQDNNNLGENDPLNKYFAYGIRNSFGMHFDPVTGNLWDTENGRDCCDEINLVEPGFNSGWRKVQGIWELNETKHRTGIFNESSKGVLVDFDGKGRYSSPEFVWEEPAAPSAIKFFQSDKLGEAYKYDIFVGDYRNGYLYHFDLDENRNNLLLGGSLKDKIADTPQELQDVIFGQGFEGITDIEVGPDGYLYVLTQGQNEQGAIIKVQPKN